MTCEVVKIITHGYPDITIFKVGGFTIGKISSKSQGLFRCLGNGRCKDSGKYKYMSTLRLNMRLGSEVKQIGKLTITKLKQ